MNHRIAQIESALKRTVAEVLSRHLSDPRVTGLVSVTRVAVSPDMHDAFVYVSVLPEKHENRTLAGLRHATGHIQALVSRAMTVRTMPRLEFRLDEGLKRQAVIDAAIHRGSLKTPTVVSDPAPTGALSQGPTDTTPEEPTP